MAATQPDQQLQALEAALGNLAIDQAPPTKASTEAERDASSDDDADDGMPVGAEACDQVQKLLVLIDFNNLIVFRDKDREVPSSIKHDFRAGSRTVLRFFVRPGAMEFIAQLAQDPRIEYAIYTSMAERNMLEFVAAFDDFVRSRGLKLPEPVPCGSASTTTASTIRDTMMIIFDRDFNARDPSAADPWDTKRDLRIVWRHPQVTKRGYGLKNTLLLECDYRKARDWVANTMQPKPFELEDVLAGTSAADTTMKDLGLAVQNIAARMQITPDVTVHLKGHPKYLLKP